MNAALISWAVRRLREETNTPRALASMMWSEDLFFDHVGIDIVVLRIKLDAILAVNSL